MKNELKDAKREDVIKVLEQYEGIVRLYPAGAKIDLSVEVIKKKG